MTVQCELNAVRVAIKHELGVSVLREVHREHWLLDAVGVSAYWGAVAALFALLNVESFGWLWCFTFVAQGFALQCLGLLSHDAFIHRKIWGDRGSWLGAMLSSFPLILCPTWYLISHRDHHQYLGSNQDTETYKESLDTTWKRLLFLTLPGDRLAKMGLFAKRNTPMPVILPASLKERRRLSTERAALIIFLVTVAGSTVIWPSWPLYGYVLPLIVVTPVASSLRVILEHAEADPTNPFHLGTYYRTGWITRVMFVADSGDCHLVHHIFSQIPWYRMAKATRLMRPVFIAKGVIERRSLPQLAGGWFVYGFAHRHPWFKPLLTRA